MNGRFLCKASALLAMSFLLAVPCRGEEPVVKLLRPSLRGVQLDTTSDEAIRKLGKPPHRKLTRVKPEDDDVGMGDLLELRYPGLLLEFNRVKRQKSFTLNQLTITGNQWELTPGVRVGMSADEAAKALGQKPEITDQDLDHSMRYYFSLNDPNCDCGFYLRVLNGKIIEIVLFEDWS